jgi:hypothetical protein
MKNMLSRFSKAAGLTVLLAAGSLRAADVHSGNVAVPFAFQVNKITMPAGEYRVEQSFGKAFVLVVNVKTGRGIQMMRDSAKTAPGATKLEFEKTGEGYRLRRVS